MVCLFKIIFKRRMKKMNIANKLTVMRVILIPFFILNASEPLNVVFRIQNGRMAIFSTISFNFSLLYFLINSTFLGFSFCLFWLIAVQLEFIFFSLLCLPSFLRSFLPSLLKYYNCQLSPPTHDILLV